MGGVLELVKLNKGWGLPSGLELNCKVGDAYLEQELGSSIQCFEFPYLSFGSF